jgi:MFS family permease
MPNLGEVYGREEHERVSRRLYLVMALALVLAGAIVFAAGATRVVFTCLRALGASGAMAHRVAVFAGALLPPALLSLALVALRAGRRARLVAAAGVALTTVGAVGFLLSTPVGWRFVASALCYVAGLLLGLAAIGRTVTGSLPTAEWESNALFAAASGVPDRIEDPLSADGGGEDDELTPLLED